MEQDLPLCFYGPPHKNECLWNPNDFLSLLFLTRHRESNSFAQNEAEQKESDIPEGHRKPKAALRAAFRSWLSALIQELLKLMQVSADFNGQQTRSLWP